jgi:acyl-CoA thioesterase-1
MIPRPRIVALGDSLTSGHGIGPSRAFPAELQRLVDRDGFDYEIVNAGVSGDTSSGGLRRFRGALDGDVRILIIALGANDGLRGIPVGQVTANLSQIIEEARSRRIAVLLCGMEALPIYGWDYSAAFHRAYLDLASKYRLSLVPFILANVLGNPSLMQPDRMHPNAEGARRIADNIWPYLRPMLRRTSAA